MIYLTSVALIFYIAGVFLEKEITEIGQLLLIISLIKCLFDNFKSKTLSLPPSTYFLFSFLIIALTSLWINAEYINRMSKHLYALRPILFGVLGIYVFRYWLKESSSTVKKWTISTILIGIIISCSYGLFIFLKENRARLDGLIYITQLGYGLALILPLLLTSLFHHKKYKNILPPLFLLVATAILAFLTLTFTYTRGAMLGFVCSLPIIIFYYKKKWGIIAGIAIFTLISLVGSYYFLGKENTSIRFIMTKNNSSDNFRRDIWITSLYTVKDRPLTGWGYLNLQEPMKMIKMKYNLPRKDLQGVHAHNNFLEVLGGTGIFGFICFLTWIILWFFETYRGSYLKKIFFIPFITVFLISGQFERTIDHRLATIVFIFYALSAQERRSLLPER